MKRSLLIFCFVFSSLMFMRIGFSECIDKNGNLYGNETGINTTDGVTSWCSYDVNVIQSFSTQSPYDRQQKVYNVSVNFGFSTNMNLVSLKGHLYNRNVSQIISIYSKGVNNFSTITTTTSTPTTTSTTTSTTSSTLTTTTVAQSGSWDGWILMVVLIIVAIVCATVVFYFKKIRGKETSDNSDNNEGYDMLESRKWK